MLEFICLLIIIKLYQARGKTTEHAFFNTLDVHNIVNTINLTSFQYYVRLSEDKFNLNLVCGAIILIISKMQKNVRKKVIQQKNKFSDQTFSCFVCSLVWS